MPTSPVTHFCFPHMTDMSNPTLPNVASKSRSDHFSLGKCYELRNATRAEVSGFYVLKKLPNNTFTKRQQCSNYLDSSISGGCLLFPTKNTKNSSSWLQGEAGYDAQMQNKFNRLLHSSQIYSEGTLWSAERTTMLRGIFNNFFLKLKIASSS